MDSDKRANPFGRLLQFLDHLEVHNIHYSLTHVLDSIMVRTYLPAGVWEIEFFEDGTLKVEIFRRPGEVKVVPEAWLDQFIEDNKD